MPQPGCRLVSLGSTPGQGKGEKEKKVERKPFSALGCQMGFQTFWRNGAGQRAFICSRSQESSPLLPKCHFPEVITYFLSHVWKLRFLLGISQKMCTFKLSQPVRGARQRFWEMRWGPFHLCVSLKAVVFMLTFLSPIYQCLVFPLEKWDQEDLSYPLAGGCCGNQFSLKDA